VDSYYYLGAQLPYLTYEQTIPMSSAEFIALAKGLMKSKKSSLLDQCTLEPNPLSEEDSEEDSKKKAKRTSSDFINRWRVWEYALRFNLAKGRAKKLQRGSEDMAEPAENPADAALVAKNALDMESSLEAEMYLDRARWNTIESFVGGGTFSESAMYAYLLKLRLMERKAMFNTEEGFTEYKRLYAAILGEAK